MSTALIAIGGKLSARFGMSDNTVEVLDILKKTAFKGSQDPTDAQLTSLLIVADQYGLNPWLKEIYAFPHKGSIVPIVGVDGWSRIINDHPQFDGMEFKHMDDNCTCVMYRKDRAHSISVTEWLSECIRTTDPWKQHPKRMLRHKSLIQCARLAFGFTGIYEQDEAERIVEIDVTPRQNQQPQAAQKPALEYCTEDKFCEMSSDVCDEESGEIKKMGWKSIVQSGKKTASQLIAMIETKYLFTEGQKSEINGWEKK